jgi:hypothetical protein
MADKTVRDRRYQYTENASKIVQRDKNAKTESNLPSGESESLVGRKLKSFGDLVSKDVNPELKQMKEKANVKKIKKQEEQKKLDISINERGNKESRSAYNQILQIVQKHYSDVSLEALTEATNEIIIILKDDNISGTADAPRDVKRKELIE